MSAGVDLDQRMASETWLDDFCSHTGVSVRESVVLAALLIIVAETMDYPPLPPLSDDSYLPSQLIEAAQAALALYNVRVPQPAGMGSAP
jgi:hypothetical protein